MFTRPKLTEPFQDVRICRESVVGERGFALAPATPLDELDFAQVTTRPRTIANLWRDAMAEGRADPAYLHEVDGEWREVTWRRGRRGGRRARERPARPRGREGTVVRAARRGRTSNGRSSTSRSRTSAPSGRRSTRRAPSATCSTCSSTHRPSASSSRTRSSARRSTAPGSPHVISFAELDDLRARGRAYAAAQSERARRARRLDRRGRPLHVHLHVGDDRPAEGLHDPAPQLLRDGAEGRRDGSVG